MFRSQRMSWCFILIVLLLLSACSTTSTKTVQLSQITLDQSVELQKSHIQFVHQYYEKLRQDVTTFIETQWIPLFLSKAVDHPQFRQDLDNAYLLSGIKVSDIDVKWKGQPFPEPQKSAVLKGVEDVVTDQKGQLGQVLLDFSEAAQTQINKIRKDLLDPINTQEEMVIELLNGAWTDLIAGQTAITAHLESVVDVQKNRDEILKKLSVLEKRDQIMDKLVEYNDLFSDLLKKKEDAEDTITEFKDKFTAFEDEIKKLIRNNDDQ